MRRLPRSGYLKMPWKNGHGTTAEIDREPSGEGAYLWRLSQASIGADGPFSSFPGYDRWLVVWRGQAIRLNEREVAPLTPVRFRGDDETACQLTGGPVEDVGLIFDRTRVNAELEVVDGSVRLSADVHYVFDLRSGDTIRHDGVSSVSVEPSLLVSIWHQTGRKDPATS